MIYTTLQLCKDNDACEEGYKKLLKGVGLNYPKDKPISLLKVLETNDLDDALWALQEASIGDNKIFSMKFGVWCARQSYKYWESEYPNDNRVLECIEATAGFIEGDVGQGELSAAWSAAESARSAAFSAWCAARSAARSAALSAWSAAESAACSAAWSAARSARSAALSARSAAESAWSAALSACSAALSARSAALSARSAALSARSAARSAQEQQFIEMLNTHKEGLE